MADAALKTTVPSKSQLAYDFVRARIDGVLLRNQLGDANGTDFALVETELTVTRDGTLVYRGRKNARFEWDAAFLGDIAIPRMISNYQVGVQQLIAAYIADPEFVSALKKR